MLGSLAQEPESRPNAGKNLGVFIHKMGKNPYKNFSGMEGAVLIFSLKNTIQTIDCKSHFNETSGSDGIMILWNTQALGAKLSKQHLGEGAIVKCNDYI